MRLKKIIFISVCLLLTGIGCGSLHGQNNSFGIKEETYSYYLKCLNVIKDSSVLKMVDTLYQMAANDQDERMKAVAFATRLDFFYYTENPDSVHANSMRFRAFARATDQPKYYYYAWGRVITYNINHNNLYAAAADIQKMQDEAIKDNDKISLVQAFQMMGRVLNGWERYEDALDYYQRAEKTIIEEDLDTQYLGHILMTEATFLGLLKRFKEAEEKLTIALPYCRKESEKYSYYYYFAKLYLTEGFINPPKAKPYMNAMKAIKTPPQSDWMLNDLYANYYYWTKQYEKSLSECDSLQHRNSFILLKAKCLDSLGRKEEAIKEYVRYYSIQEEESKVKFNQRIGDQSGFLRINELKNEKNKLELELRTRWLYITIVASCILVLVFVVVLSQLYRIRNLNVKLRKSEEIKSAFLKNLSHEVRTPLNSIMGFSELLTSHDDNMKKEEKEHFSEIITENCRMLVKLVSDALELSDVKTVSDALPVDINKVCTKLVEHFKPDCQEGVDIIFTPCPNDPIIISDEDEINKVVANLIGNATKFTSSGSITVKAESVSKSKFQISVTDTGIGIAQDQQKNVFESFYKVDPMTQGLGLGLTLSRIVAGYMNGDIKIDPSYTDGCRIIFTFQIG